MTSDPTSRSEEQAGIELDQVQVRFPARGVPGGLLTAVDEVSFALTPGAARVVSLVGQSGSGKSTIARVILGLQPITAGQLRFRGTEVRRLDRSARAEFRRTVQPVFQDPYAIFNPFYRVDRVLWTAVTKFGLARGHDEGAQLINEALTAVRLDPDAVLGRYPHQLSGGQRQRIMLARIQLLKPSFVIADEPVSMLDAQVRKAFLDLLLDLGERLSITTLFITHDLSTVHYLGGDVMVIRHGRIVERGPVRTVLTTPSHPYTARLLASVPVPDPKRRWTDKITVDELDQDDELLPTAAPRPEVTGIIP